MRVSRAIEALKIIVEAEPGAEMDAQYDTIYVGGGADHSVYSEGALRLLEALGFHKDENERGFYAHT